MFLESPSVPPTPCGTPDLAGVRVAPPKSILVCRDAHNAPIRLGHGGTRGSCVYLVQTSGVRRALKSCRINPSELAFCRAAQRCIDDNGIALDGSDDILHLACPIFLVAAESFSTKDDFASVKPAGVCSDDDTVRDIVGIIMPFFDASLHRLLGDPLAMRTISAITGQRAPLAKDSSSSPSDVDSPRRSNSSDSSSNDEDASLPFHTARQQHRVRSLVVITAILDSIVRGVSFLHYRLPHETADEDCRGFAHQDLRSDNILISRDGNVAICDFELIGHFPAATATGRSPNTQEGPVHSLFNGRASTMSASFSSVDGGEGGNAIFTRRNGTRLIPRGFHAPEGPNMVKSDVWLIGLIAIELFTGVCPFIRANVALDDFGAGPLLTVDPENGIGWDNIEAHVTSRIRPWPPTDHTVDPILKAHCEAKGKDYAEELRRFVDAFRSFCSRCFANNPKDRADPQQLRDHALFDLLREVSGSASNTQALISAWIKSSSL